MRVVEGDLCHKIIRDRNEHKLSFGENKDYDTWRAELKEKFLDLIGIENVKANACPLNMEIEEKVEFDDYTRIRFTFESEVGAVVPCYLLIPKLGKQKYPLAITMQGHATGFHNSVAIPKYPGDEDYIKRGDFSIQAIKNGYCALAIEQRGMGERRPRGPYQDGAQMCAYEAQMALLLSRTILAERIWDVSKAIDLMVNFPEVDMDKIMMMGNSGGGTATFYTACYDERIKLAIPSCAFCTYSSSILDRFHCSCNFIPRSYEYFEMQDVATLLAPRNVIFLAGVKDEIFPIEGTREAYETVKKIYAKAGAPDKCKLIETPMGHWWCADLIWPAIKEEIQKMGW